VATPPDDVSIDSREMTVRRAAAMSGGTLLSRLTGLIRVSVTLAALGLTGLSDVYAAANTTPNIVYELIVGGILTSVLVPVLIDRSLDDGERWATASRILTFTVVVLAVGAAAAMLFAPVVMRLYLAGLPDGPDRDRALSLGVVFLRWFMPQMVFYGVTAVASGILTTERRFTAQMLAPVLNNLAVIVTMVVFIVARDGASPAIDDLTSGQRTVLGAGTTLGVIAMALALWPALRRAGFRWRPRFDWSHRSIAMLWRLGGWVVVYVAANQLTYLVIISLNADVGPGTYTAYSQAFIFFSLPHAIVAVSVVTALLPGMAERWNAGDAAGVRDLFSRGFRDTQVAMLPAAAGYVALAAPIVGLLAAYGAVETTGQRFLAEALAGFAIGLPFFSAYQLLTRTFYATRDSRTPALTNIGVGVVNLLAAVWFTRGLDLGVFGLALAHAVSYAAGASTLFWLIGARLGGADTRHIAATLGRCLVAATISGVVAFGVSEGVAGLVATGRPAGRAVQVTVGVVVGVLVFVGASLMMRVREVDEVREALRMRFRR